MVCGKISFVTSARGQSAKHHPEHTARSGFAETGDGKRGLADLCRLLLETTPTVCLFVRPENAPAIALYDSIGMRRTMTYRSLIFG